MKPINKANIIKFKTIILWQTIIKDTKNQQTNKRRQQNIVVTIKYKSCKNDTTNNDCKYTSVCSLLYAVCLCIGCVYK